MPTGSNFPADIESMIREIDTLSPGFFTNITRSSLEEYDNWQRCLAEWSRGERLDEGRQTLNVVLEHLRKSKQ